MRVVGYSEAAPRPPSADSLTLKLTEAYSRATGRCRVILLGVCFRRESREMQQGKDGEPIAIAAYSAHLYTYIGVSPDRVLPCFPGPSAGRAC